MISYFPEMWHGLNLRRRNVYGRGYKTGRGHLSSQLKVGVVLKIFFRKCAFNIKAYKK